MHKSVALSGLLISLILIGLFSIFSIEPAPVYSQDIQNEIPYLLGVNIYFSEANGEVSQFDRSTRGISRFAGLLRLAGANLLTLEWRKGIPDNADMVVIIAPNSDLPTDQVARLWSYLQNGGKVLLIADAFNNNGDVTNALTSRGIFDFMWNDLGIQARQDVVVFEGEPREVSVQNTNNEGQVIFEFTGELPELLTKFQTSDINDDHPITSGLASMIVGGDSPAVSNLNSFFFDGSRSLQVDASLDQDTLTPLIFTDNSQIYGETDFRTYRDNGYAEYNPEEDTPRGDLILAASYENPIGSKMVLVGDSDFVRNGGGFVTAPSYTGSFVYPLNVHFMMESIGWLLGRDAEVPALPTPGATATATLTPTPTVEPTSTPEDGQ